MDIPKTAISKFANGETNVTEEPAIEPVIMETEEPLASSMDFVPGDLAPTNTDDDDDDVVITGVDNADTATVAESAVDAYSKVVEEGLANIKAADPDAYANISSGIITDISKYKRDLIINEGLTAEEATQAAKKRLATNIRDSYTKYYDEHPETVVIEVNAKDKDKVEFTEEQQKKLEAAKKIRLVSVTDQKLATLNIKEVAREEKINIIHRKSCTLSQYTLPFFSTRDMCTFSGANIFQLSVGATVEKDENGRVTEAPLPVIQRKSQFIYEHFICSATRTKFDDNDQVIMTYDDFIKWFKFNDIDTAIYAIYVASSTEMLTSVFNCYSEQCLASLEPNQKRFGKSFEASYNSKNVISYDDIIDEQKAIMDAILTADQNMDAMTKIQKENSVSFRMQSTFTKNIYEFASPSIADAIITIKDGGIAPDDDDSYINAYVMWTRAIYLYDGDDANGEATYVAIRDIPELIDYYKNIIETERYIINATLDKYVFEPAFIVKTKCPNCGNTSDIKLDISDLVFLRTRSIEAEII